MKVYFLTLFLFIFNITTTVGCLSAYQFKIFPVGIYDNNIITLDFKIQRTEERDTATPELKAMFILQAFIGEYDDHQNLLAKDSIETTISKGMSYLDTLQHVYSRGLNLILKKYPGIKMFSTEYISFCDFQQACNLVKLDYDSVGHKDYILHGEERYLINTAQDTSYYAFSNKSIYHRSSLKSMYFSSVRKFKSGNTVLIVVHAATGHELAMGMITSDPEKAKDQFVSLAEEHTPDVDFHDIKYSVYEEPLLHHGYGFDVFFVE